MSARRRTERGMSHSGHPLGAISPSSLGGRMGGVVESCPESAPLTSQEFTDAICGYSGLSCGVSMVVALHWGLRGRQVGHGVHIPEENQCLGTSAFFASLRAYS